MGVENGTAVLCFKEEDEVVGAIGAIYGTGEHQYKDTHVMQIQIVQLLEPYRKSGLFLNAFLYLMQYLDQSNRNVAEIRFWAPGNDELRKLFSKVAVRTDSQATKTGSLDEYRASYSNWQAYAARFRQASYF